MEKMSSETAGCESMKKKVKWGIRKKASAVAILLILVPAVFIVLVSYSYEGVIENGVRVETYAALKNTTINDTRNLNLNATDVLDNYLGTISLEAQSAGRLVSHELGRDLQDVDYAWESEYLLEQLNKTMISEIADGNLSNENYTEMVDTAGAANVSRAVYYLLNTPSLNYSSDHVNASAYAAIRALEDNLSMHNSTALSDFLYSVMLPEYRADLDYIKPVGDMLYYFRGNPDVLQSYFTSEDSGFTVLTPIPNKTGFSPLFNAHVRTWYVNAKEEGKPVWSSAYVDEITGCPMVTYSVPVYSDGKLLGVVGFDLLLSEITEKTRQFYISNSSFAFVMDSSGIALAYPSHGILGDSLTSGDSVFNRTMSSILGSERGIVNTTLGGDNYMAIYSTIGGTGWKFVNMLNLSELHGKSRDIAENEGQTVFRGIMYIIMIETAVGLIAFVVAFLLVDSYVRMVERLTEYADEVSRGNFAVTVNLRSEDEIKRLETAVKRLVNSYRVAMEQIEKRENEVEDRKDN